MLLSVILLLVLFLPHFYILRSFISQSLKKIGAVCMSFIGQMVLDCETFHNHNLHENIHNGKLEDMII